MIDICFSDSVAGTLMQIRKDIHSDGVFPLDLHLNYEHIDCDVVEIQARRNINTLKYFYKSITNEELQNEYIEELENTRNAVKTLEQFLIDGQDIRLWLSNTANDRCGLYWFCHLAKDYTNKISMAVCPGYEYSPSTQSASIQKNWALFSNPAFVASFASSARILEKHEKAAYAREWTLLVKEDSPLRILIDDTIVGVEESFFDKIILGFLTLEPQPQNTVMGKMLGKWQGVCDVAFISMRIEHLIADGKIKICEEKVDEHDCYWLRTIALMQK